MTMIESTLKIPVEWRDVAEEIAGTGGPVIVIGAPGTGKTTFSIYLTGYLCRRGTTVAWVDADPGQPFMGPPGVLSLNIYTDPADILKRRPPLAMSFIGNTSPVGHLLEMVGGIHKLGRRSYSYNNSLLLVNTCGLVAGGAARELKFHAVDIVSPRFVVALQKEVEVEHLLYPHAFRSGLLIRRLPVPPEAKALTREARLAARERRFKEYFRGAGFQDIFLSDVGVHGPGLKTGVRLGFRDINRLSKIIQGIVVYAELASDRLFLLVDGDYADEELYGAREQYGVREVVALRTRELDHLLVGLNDGQNICLALGILRSIDVKEQVIKVITPLRDIAPVRIISIGTLRVSPAGAELGRW